MVVTRTSLKPEGTCQSENLQKQMTLSPTCKVSCMTSASTSRTTKQLLTLRRLRKRSRSLTFGTQTTQLKTNLTFTPRVSRARCTTFHREWPTTLARTLRSPKRATISHPTQTPTSNMRRNSLLSRRSTVLRIWEPPGDRPLQVMLGQLMIKKLNQTSRPTKTLQTSSSQLSKMTANMSVMLTTQPTATASNE